MQITIYSKNNCVYCTKAKNLVKNLGLDYTEKKLEEFAIEGSAPSFRLFLSSDPSNDIPIGLLEKSIKLTNEPPQGVK